MGTNGHATYSINSNPSNSQQSASDACVTVSALQIRTIRFRKMKSVGRRHRADQTEAQPHNHGRYSNSGPLAPAGNHCAHARNLQSGHLAPPALLCPT